MLIQALNCRALTLRRPISPRRFRAGEQRFKRLSVARGTTTMVLLSRKGSREGGAGMNGSSGQEDRFLDISDMLKAVDRNRFLVLAAVGYGLCRCLSAFPFAVYATWPGASIAGDVGKLAGIILCSMGVAGFFRCANHWCTCCMQAFVVGFGVVLSIGCRLVPMSMQGFISTLSAFSIGLGTAAMMLTWLDMISRVSMRSIVTAIAGAEFLNSWSAISISSATVMEPLAFILLFIVTALLLYCRWGWDACPAAAPDQVDENKKVRAGTWSWRLAVWVGVYCLAYGLVTEYMGLTTSSFSNSLGNLIPCAVTLATAFFLPGNFDLKMLKNTAFVFMVAGLVIVGIAGTQGLWVQLLAGAGAASCRLFAYSLACMRAHVAGVSSIPLCGAVKAIIVITTNAGLFLGTLSMPFEGTMLVVALALTVTLLSAFMSPFDVDDKRIIEQAFHVSNTADVERRLELLAHKAKLSERETTVMALMARGLATSDISERLFISKSAVRAHQSRIYAKFGIHNQQELIERILEEIPDIRQG